MERQLMLLILVLGIMWLLAHEIVTGGKKYISSFIKGVLPA